MSRPYQVGSLAGKSVSAVQPDASKLFAAAPQFSPDAFQKSRLFNSSGAKASGQQAKSFTMLGVSMGEKNSRYCAILKQIRIIIAPKAISWPITLLKKFHAIRLSLNLTAAFWR